MPQKDSSSDCGDATRLDAAAVKILHEEEKSEKIFLATNVNKMWPSRGHITHCSFVRSSPVESQHGYLLTQLAKCTIAHRSGAYFYSVARAAQLCFFFYEKNKKYLDGILNEIENFANIFSFFTNI